MFVRRSGGVWERPAVQWYADEAELQQLVAESPHLVGADGAVVALREFGLAAAGTVDVLLVALDGTLTLVEAKLNRNPEIRRAVVGQLLGYAGALWGMRYEDLDAVVQQREGAALVDLARGTAGDGEDVFDAEVFRAQVASQLREGAFRLVFAVDQTTEDLRRAAEYLNAHLGDAVEVRVLELCYAKLGDVEILVPTTFGEEAARRKQRTRTGRRWTEEDFFAALDQRASTDEAARARRLIDWARPRVSLFYWGEGQTPSCTLVFDTPEGEIQPAGVYFTPSGPTIGIHFQWMRKRPQPAIEQTLSTLSALPRIAALADDITSSGFRKRPAVKVAHLNHDDVDLITGALDALLDYPADG